MKAVIDILGSIMFIVIIIAIIIGVLILIYYGIKMFYLDVKSAKSYDEYYRNKYDELFTKAHTNLQKEYE